MDLFPTFCNFTGANVPDPIEGRDLVPVFQGTTAKVRDVLYTAYGTVQRAVRDDRWKLIRYPEVNITQLFDLQADPRELTNLAEQPEHAGKVREMMAVLQKEMNAYNDITPLEVANPKPAAWSPPDPAEKAERNKRKAKRGG